MVFSPDSHVLASVSLTSPNIGGVGRSSQLKTWDCSTGSERFSRDIENVAFLDIAFNRQGSRILAIGFGLTHVFDLASGGESRYQTLSGCKMVLAPGGREVALARGIMH